MPKIRRSMVFSVVGPGLRTPLYGESRRRRSAERLGDGLVGEALELARLRAGAVEGGDLEVGGGDRAGRRRVLAQRLHGQPDGSGEVEAFGVVLAEMVLDLLALPAHHPVPLDVGDRAVVGEAVDLIAGRVIADLGYEQLDLVRLLAARREDRAERLRVRVGQPAAGDVAAVVGVSTQVGQANSRNAQVLELVV